MRQKTIEKTHKKQTKIPKVKKHHNPEPIIHKETVKQSRKSLWFWAKIAIACILFFVVLSGALLAFVSLNPRPSALFADNVLRPLFGDQNVIAFEGFVFAVQDKINQKFKYAPSKSSYSVAIKTVVPPQALRPPPNIIPFVDTANPLQDEGVWKRISGKDLFTTFIRTDPSRPYSIVNLVYIPLKNISVNSVAGIKYPGGTLGRPGPGIIPPQIQNTGTIIAAFNGGFQEKDGHYGMYANRVMYVPMQKNLATLFIYKNGKAALLPFNESELTADVVSARQNGPFLVKNGKTTQITAEGIDLWAGTASGGYVTWRSGIGINAEGDLIYAMGPSLTPTALADALRLATSQDAMQLDINNFWVRFFLYTWDSKTKTYSSLPLIKAMPDDGSNYLTGYEKDFFYLAKK